jgi:propionyl-CoA synthetase
MAQFNSLFQQSINKPEEFWAEAAAGIDWIKQWEQVLDSARPPFYRWFAGATMNTCYNAVDRHVETGRGEQTAIIYDSPVTMSSLWVAWMT